MLFQLRTFLIRNGLSTLFNRGSGAYKTYYSRQMTKWNISTGKKKQLTELLDKWAVHIQRKYGKARSQPLPDTYLSEAEPFLEEFAKLSPKNQALIGTAGSLVRAEDFMAILDEGMDEDEDLEMETEVPSGLSPGVKATKQDESLIVFFPGIPGCGKSALCKVILDSPGILGDDRPVHSLMCDFVKGQYWAKVDDACRRKPSSILLADKNAPNEEVWSQIEEMCGSVITYAVPVITDTEGFRPRDIRSMDPSLWLTNSMPALLVVEAALHSRIQRLEHRLMDLEPRVQALLEVLPNRLTAEVLEELRISKQALVELASRAGALKQMLLDILEDPDEIRHICIMGRNCTSKRGSHLIECSVPLEKQIAEEEEEEIEMLLENYLQSMRTTAIDASLGDSDGGRGVGLKKRCR